MTINNYAFGSTISRATSDRESIYNGFKTTGVETSYPQLSEDPMSVGLWAIEMADAAKKREALKAKETQVGGDHYKKAGNNMQPWDIIDAWGLDYYGGTVLKYLLRYKHKNGKEDLEKARHFLDKMIEDYENAS